MRQPLPPKPVWFDKELAEVYTHDGKPMFRVVNGQTETHFFNGKPNDIKHWDIDPKKGRVGKNCWVIEFYQSPSEISRQHWAAARYQWVSHFGADPTLDDILGPYPENGRYVHYRSLRNADGSPQPLTKAVIHDIKQDIAAYMQNKSISGEEEVEKYNFQKEQWMRDSAHREAEEFYQAHGMAAMSAFHHTEVGRPMRRIWLPGDK